MAKEQLLERTLDQMDDTQFVPLRDVGFDLAVGGGTPQNCIIEIFGSEASGKTTLCFEIANTFLKQFPKKNVYYYNYERSIDKFYVRNLIKDEECQKRFKIVDPIYLEDGMDHLFQVMDTKLGSLCIVDSLAAMTPKDEAEKALDKAQVGGFKAKAMAEVCRKIGVRLGEGAQTTVVFINHVNPVLGGFSFIPQQITPGGKAVKFWASLRIEITVVDRLTKEEVVPGTTKKEKIPYGNVCRLKVEKNKFSPPYRRALTYIILGHGIDRAMSLIDYGIQIGIIGMKNKMDYFLTGREADTIRGKVNFANKINQSQKLFDYLYSRIASYIEARRMEQKNINVDQLSEGNTFEAPNGDQIKKESEVEEMFRGLQSEETGDDYSTEESSVDGDAPETSIEDI